MADQDDYEKFLSQAPSGPVSVPSGSGEDEYAKFLRGEVTTPADNTKAIEETIAGDRNPSIVDKDYEAFLAGQVGERPGFGATFSGGLARNWAQFKAMPSSLKAVYLESQGDVEGARAAALEAQGIMAEAPQANWDWTKIQDKEDFALWLTEKLGEQGITALATLATAGAGGLGATAVGGALAARGLISTAGQKALQLGGMMAPSYALSTGMETSGTSQEQFEVTGSTQPGISIAAGATKGLLELWAPMSIAKALTTPGLQLGKSLPGAVAKLMVKEGSTELAQEAIDITARKYSDPGYSFFGSGPDWWRGEGFVRLVEAGLAGAAVGGIYGGPGAIIEQRQERGKGDRTLGDQEPGAREVVPLAPGAQAEPSPPEVKAPRERTLDDYIISEGPVTNLRKLVIPPQGSLPFLEQRGGFFSGIRDRFKARQLERNDPGGLEAITGGEGSDSAAGIIRTDLRTHDRPNSIGYAGQPIARVEGRPSAANEAGAPADRLRVVEPTDKLTLEQRASSPLEDFMGITPLLHSVFGFEKKTRDEALDFVEAQTDRYVEILPDGKLGNRLFTNTEAELDMSINRPQGERPRWLKVDQGALQPAAITAHELDLPPPGDDRIWFLPGVPAAKQAELLQRYQALENYGDPLASAEQAELNIDAKGEYGNLITEGLRVVPSRGAGFYYNGTIVGDEVAEVSRTNRSDFVGIYNPVDRTVSRFAPSIEGLMDSQQLKAGGILVQADLNKLSSSDYIELPDGTYQLSASVVPGVLTPGVIPTDVERMYGPPVGYQDGAETKVYVDGPFYSSQTTADRIRRALMRIAPIIDKVLNDVGIKYPLALHLTDKRPEGVGISPAWILVDQGVLGISPENYEKHMMAENISTGDLDADILSIVMHEVGHQVTFEYYRTLPRAQQELLTYAHQRSLLAGRMDPYSARSGFPGLKPKAIGRMGYYLRFDEWLAEQFRRWTVDDQEVRSTIDQLYAYGARRLDLFYKSWSNNARFTADILKPDFHFSAVMQYLRDYAKEADRLRQLERQQTLYVTGEDVLESPALTAIITQVMAALKSMEAMFPEEVKVHLNSVLDPHIIPGQYLPFNKDTIARAIPNKNQQLIELAVGAMPEEGAEAAARQTFAHELMHVYEKLKLITEKEMEILFRDMPPGKDPVQPNVKAGLKVYIKELADERTRAGQPGYDQAWVDATYTSAIRSERLAYYVDQFANTGVAYSDEARSILSRLMEVLERVKNYLYGLGFTSRDDVLRAFFRGEMLERAEREARMADRAESAARQQWKIDQNRRDLMQPHKVEEVAPGLYMAAEYFDGSNSYMFLEGQQGLKNPELGALGKIIGHVWMDERKGKGWELSDLEADGGPAFTPRMAAYIGRDLGIPLDELLKPPSEATTAGKMIYAWGARSTPFKGVFDYYVKDPQQDNWYSPNKVKQMYSFWQVMSARIRAGLDANGFNAAEVSSNLAKWKALKAKVPAKAWTDPRLDQMFSLKRNWQKDEVQGSIAREAQRASEARLMKAVGFPAGPTSTGFERAHELSTKLSQADQARNQGLSFDAASPRTALTLEMRKTWEWATGYGHSTQVDKVLGNRTMQEADRIGWFTKMFWGLHQLAWRNEHIKGLREYLQNTELSNQMATTWLRTADETARAWEDIKGPQQREGVSKVLFWLTEMGYRTPAEIQAGTKRHPTSQEFVDKVKTEKLDAKSVAIIQRVQGDFSNFLNAVEQVRMKLLARTFAANPAGLQTAVAKLQAEMAELRAKPYFPMVRFGEFTITVRDGNQNNKVVYAGAYATQSQRDAAVKDVRKAYPIEDITVGRVPEDMTEFLGLPAPLLNAIKENLFDKAGKSPDQIALIDEQMLWLEEFEMINAPDKSFAKRWMPTAGLPGYSPDAFRAYSHYFLNGARYLSRLAFMNELRDNIGSVQASVRSGKMGNSAKRQEIVKYMRDHYNYMMEPGRDSGKFRAAVSLWFLGFSPAAAAMNLTQIPTVLVPWLGGHFGHLRAYGVINQGLNALRSTNGYAVGNATFTKIRDEMVNQGRIEVGQAPELGAFAEGYNLNKLMTGERVQRAYRGLSYWGMKMFGAVEHYNRELTLKTAYDLAIKFPQTKRLLEIEQKYIVEIGDLTTRLGISIPEAVAFLFARESIDRTQFQFAKYTDPPFMRGKQAKNFLIFFKYMQSMMYALRFNTGQVHMLLVLAVLYGVKGLPGSEDMNELLRLLAKKIFGKDIDLMQDARAFARDVTRGTVFDKTGPDLFMHGISRYSFALGLLPQHWGAPRFDASANGSMGKIIPGFADFAHGAAIGKPYAEIVADAVQKTSGAGYGYFFSLAQYLMAKPGTQDSKKWETLAPRFARAYLKAYRYGFDPGAETTQSGAKIVKFDARDPDDIATVAAQAFGFTPTKVSETWEMIREARESLQVYQTRRVALYAQLDKAIQSGNAEAAEDVYRSIRTYNEQVIKIDPNQVIQSNQLRQALIQRNRARLMQENFLAPNKQGIPVTRRIQDLYPGVQIQKVD